MKKLKLTAAEIIRLQKAVSDPDWQLRLFQKSATDSPLYYWLAIDVCITDNRPFPDWIRDYLGKGADRFKSAYYEERKGKRERARMAKQARRLGNAKQVHKAKRAPEIGERVLGILGFPKNEGPRSLLDPDYGTSAIFEEIMFILRFAELFDQIQDSVIARRTAGQETFGDRPDDRTLERCLKRHLHLKSLRLTTAAWKTVIDRYRAAATTVLFRELKPLDDALRALGH